MQSGTCRSYQTACNVNITVPTVSMLQTDVSMHVYVYIYIYIHRLDGMVNPACYITWRISKLQPKCIGCPVLALLTYRAAVLHPSLALLLARLPWLSEVLTLRIVWIGMSDEQLWKSTWGEATALPATFRTERAHLTSFHHRATKNSTLHLLHNKTVTLLHNWSAGCTYSINKFHETRLPILLPIWQTCCSKVGF